MIIFGMALFSIEVNLIRRFVRKADPLEVILEKSLAQIFVSFPALILFSISLPKISHLPKIFLWNFLIFLPTNILSALSMKKMHSYGFTLLTTIIVFIGSSLLSLFWLGETLTTKQIFGLVFLFIAGIVGKWRKV